MPNFNITLWQAPGRRGIGDNARGFIKAVTIKPGDTAALFFAGHGVAISGVNYLIPSDVPAVTEGAEARVRGASHGDADAEAAHLPPGSGL